MTAMQLLVTLLFIFLMFTQAANHDENRNQSQPLANDDEVIFRHPGIMRPIEWNSAQEPWLTFQIRLCRRMCNGTQDLTYTSAPYALCTSTCFPCDCNATCTIYGTCCPHFHPSTPLKEQDRIIDGDGGRFVGNLSDYEFIDTNDDAIHVSNPSLGKASIYRGRFRCTNTIWPRMYGHEFYMIKTCPASESNKTLRHLCESNDDNMELMSSLFLAPLTDSRSGVTFKNKYCAECNYFAQFQTELKSRSGLGQRHLNTAGIELDPSWNRYLHPWEIEINCASYQEFYRIDSEIEFLKAVRRQADRGYVTPSYGCRVTLTLPLGIKSPHRCTSRLPDLEDGTNNTCSPLDTPVYRTLESLCHSQESLSFRSWSKANIFCYMCQDDLPPCIYLPPINPNKTLHDTTQVLSPLAFLLGSRSKLALFDGNLEVKVQGVTDTFLCEGNLQWMDSQGVCQFPQCTAGKNLNLNSEGCDTVIRRINSLRYKVFMVIIPNHVIFLRDLRTIEESLSAYFDKAIGASLQIHYVIYRSDSSLQEAFMHIAFVKIEGSVQASFDLNRDTFEESLLRDTSRLDENEPWFHVFNNSRTIFGDETTTVLLNQRFRTEVYDFNFREKILRDSSYPGPITTNSPQEQSYARVVSNRLVKNDRYNYLYGLRLGGREDFIDLNPSLLCPFVEFNVSDIYWQNNNYDVSIGFYYSGEEKRFNVSRYADQFCLMGGKLKMCISVFRNEFQRITNESSLQQNVTVTISNTGKAIRYLTVICLGISVCSLILSIVTYFLFPALRNLPGLNTLTLCLCLTFAQLCLIAVTFLVGRIDGWPCQLLGILLHYGWLAAFHWMSVCCIHMFTVFNKTQARFDSPNVWKPFMRYSSFAFGISAFYICLHVTLSEIVSDGVSFGYSPRLCLFDITSSHLPPIFSFVLPLGIVVISNGALFFLTIRKIMSVRRLQETIRTNKKSREEVVTYVKLSTLTGLFWLLTILAVQLDDHVLTLISTPLVALQGLFIFFSFTVNARVKSLYVALLASPKHTEDTVTLPTASTTVGMLQTQGEQPRVSRDKDDRHKEISQPGNQI